MHPSVWKYPFKCDVEAFSCHTSWNLDLLVALDKKKSQEVTKAVNIKCLYHFITINPPADMDPFTAVAKSWIAGSVCAQTNYILISYSDY